MSTRWTPHMPAASMHPYRFGPAGASSSWPRSRELSSFEFRSTALRRWADRGLPRDLRLGPGANPIDRHGALPRPRCGDALAKPPQSQPHGLPRLRDPSARFATGRHVDDLVRREAPRADPGRGDLRVADPQAPRAVGSALPG